jgi:hypothetical protein
MPAGGVRVTISGPRGLPGEDFGPDATGLLGDRSSYDDQPEKFVFLATDTADLYFRETATPGVWSLPVPFGTSTDLSITNRTASQLTVASNNGTDAVVPPATVALAGLMSADQVVKLAGVESGAQVNSLGLPIPAVDRVSTRKDAAQFLRMATFGPTLAEIDDLVAIGSKAEWMQEQIAGSFNGSAYAEWGTSGGALTPLSGWFGGVAVKFAPPVGWQQTTPLRTRNDNPGFQLIGRCIHTAFIRNNPSQGGLMTTTGSGDRAPNKSLLCRCVWILSKLLPVSFPGGGFASSDDWNSVGYFTLLAQRAFGRYEDLVEAMAYHVSMSFMLTHYKNSKAVGDTRPDENFAREILQLMTMGLNLLDDGGNEVLDPDGLPIPNYSNADIAELAKVFTGMVTPVAPENDYYTTPVPASLNNPTEGAVRASASASCLPSTVRYGTRKPLATVEKGQTYRIFSVGTDAANFTRLGADGTPAATEEFVATADGTPDMISGVVEQKRIYPPGLLEELKHSMALYETGQKILPTIGLTIPANTDPETNIKMAVRAFVRHPSTAPYICKRLIKMATTSNPSPEYVARVVNVFRDNGQGVVGDMASVWPAIFLDPEANNTIGTDQTFGRVRDPWEALVGLMRPLNCCSLAVTPAQGANVTTDIFYNDTYQQGRIGGFIGTLEPANFPVLPAYSPSIFGYYPPEYSQFPASGWDVEIPEMGAWTASGLATIVNSMVTAINNGPDDFRDRTTANTNTSRYMPPAYDGVGLFGDIATVTAVEIVDILDLILCGGKLSRSKKKILSDLVATLPTATTANREDRISAAIYPILRSPEFFVQ